MEIYFVSVEDLDDYEAQDVIMHTITIDKAKEIALYYHKEYAESGDKTHITVGRSEFDEEGILRDYAGDTIEVLENGHFKVVQI